MLVDGDALRDAFGVKAKDRSLGIPRKAGGVERIQDPKQLLSTAYLRAVDSRRARASDLVNFLAPIAERVSLIRIRQVPAFQQFEKDLSSALRDLGYIT